MTMAADDEEDDEQTNRSRQPEQKAAMTRKWRRTKSQQRTQRKKTRTGDKAEKKWTDTHKKRNFARLTGRAVCCPDQTEKSSGKKRNWTNGGVMQALVWRTATTTIVVVV